MGENYRTCGNLAWSDPGAPSECSGAVGNGADFARLREAAPLEGGAAAVPRVLVEAEDVAALLRSVLVALVLRNGEDAGNRAYPSLPAAASVCVRRRCWYADEPRNPPGARTACRQRGCPRRTRRTAPPLARGRSARASCRGNRPGRRRTLPPRWPSCGGLFRFLPQVGVAVR
jgi:hypothetical protein